MTDPAKRVVLPKKSFKDGEGPSWHVIAGTVFIRCKCGKVLGSPTNHIIQGTGQIDASIICGTCGWHEYCILNEWTYGLMDVGEPKDVN